MRCSLQISANFPFLRNRSNFQPSRLRERSFKAESLRILARRRHTSYLSWGLELQPLVQFPWMHSARFGWILLTWSYERVARSCLKVVKVFFFLPFSATISLFWVLVEKRVKDMHFLLPVTLNNLLFNLQDWVPKIIKKPFWDFFYRILLKLWDIYKIIMVDLHAFSTVLLQEFWIFFYYENDENLNSSV